MTSLSHEASRDPLPTTVGRGLAGRRYVFPGEMQVCPGSGVAVEKRRYMAGRCRATWRSTRHVVLGLKRRKVLEAGLVRVPLSSRVVSCFDAPVLDFGGETSLAPA